MEVPFVGSSYKMDARSFSVQRTINMYPLSTEIPNTKAVEAIRGTAGLSLFATVGGGYGRGSISSTSGRAFVVSGDGFYELFDDGTSTLHGSLNTQTVRVSIAENSTQIIVVDGTDGWIFTKATDSWDEITSVNFPSCTNVSYQDGYFITFETNSQKFYISNLNDGMTWDALDFTSVESSPDDLTGIISDNGNVWLFGNRSTEVYQNTGNADFPFERIAGAIIQTGCAAGFTVQKFDNTIAWLGVDEQGRGVVWKADGYQARRLSTQAIESRINSVEDFSESYAWVYHQQGHIFYMLQIKGLNTTLVYDGATGLWHERSFLDTINNRSTLHRGSSHFFFAQKNLITDRETGEIFELSLDFQDDNGTPQIRERISPHYYMEKSRVKFASFELDCEVGQGLTSGQGSDPKIMLQYSDDQGYTWSNELWVSLGKKGEYHTRAIWRQLGQARDRVFKVKVSDPVFVQINKAYVNGS